MNLYLEQPSLLLMKTNKFPGFGRDTTFCEVPQSFNGVAQE
jgi:hypothetical protein